MRLDVGLPLECTVAELIPQLVRLSGSPPLDAASVAVTLVTAFLAATPMISLRLPLPHVPADMQSSREDERPASGAAAPHTQHLAERRRDTGRITVAVCIIRLRDKAPDTQQIDVHDIRANGVARLARLRKAGQPNSRLLPDPSVC